VNITPDIPRLDPMRVQVRKHALLNAIEEKPRRRWWRIAVPATVLTAAAIATTVLWTPTTPSAYASWTAEPRAPGPDVDRMIADCREKLVQHDRNIRSEIPNWPAAPTEVSVVDQRGDLTMVLFTGPESDMSCLISPKGFEMGGGGGSPGGRPPLGSARFRTQGLGASDPDPGQGEPRRTLIAQVGPDVAKARINTEDGRQVTATLGNGWLVAWWPTKAKATTVTLYDRAGGVLGTDSAEIK
jgi:hypothetical protein